MSSIAILDLILLITGAFLLLVGVVFFFFPKLLIRWNALGNTWIGTSDSAVIRTKIAGSLFAINYALFARHKITGLVLWVLSCIFIIIYIFA